MLYTIADVSNLIHLSKVSIYKKLKLKELQGYIMKKQGITYIDEVGFNLLKDSLKLKESVKTELQYNNIESSTAQEIAMDADVLTINKELIKALIDQLKAKDLQIQELTNRLAQEQDLHKNTQILLKGIQDKPILELETHFKELDTKLLDLRQHLQERKEKSRSWIDKLFHRL